MYMATGPILESYIYRLSTKIGIPCMVLFMHDLLDVLAIATYD